MYLKIFLRCIFILLPVIAQAQQETEVLIQPTSKGDLLQFNAALPPLKPVPGGRAPFYTYLWDFGDGHFSTQAVPEHSYAQEGDYTVQLYAVNNYDDGIRPPRPVKKTIHQSSKAVNTAVSNAELNFFTSNGIFQLAKNASALPGEDMVLTAGIKTNGKGRIFILTNEKMYDKAGLIYRSQSQYNHEKMIPQDSLKQLQEAWAAISKITITQSGSPDYGNRIDKNVNARESVKYFSKLYNSYNTVTAYEVAANGSAQFSFINLDVAPDMMKDTNAIITITGIYLPESGQAVVHQLEVPVVASHDPNKMSLKGARMSYRFMAKHKELVYKVQFQNDGEGDAKNIRLEMQLPGSLDPTTFKLLHLSPQCPPCADSNSRGCWRTYIKEDQTLVFHFKDISLPGTKAKDIKDENSTKGFIRFSVLSGKRLKNSPFKSRTQIFFDKNEPITTNSATGRFRKSLSPIIFGGYHGILQGAKPELDATSMSTQSGWLAGIGLAPLAPYRKLYWQVEVYMGSQHTYAETDSIAQRGQVIYNGKLYDYTAYDKKIRTDFLQLAIVPLHIRYNMGKYLAIGVGAMVNIDVKVSEKIENTYHLPINGRQPTIYTAPIESSQGKTGNIRYRPFIDLSLGKVTLGPSIGARYIFDGKQGQFIDIYAAWRF